MEERRRAQRIEWTPPRSEVTFAADVQVLDISTHGMLLRSKAPIAVGSRGSLGFELTGVPFQMEVEIKRVVPSESDNEDWYCVAARFLSISKQAQEFIERFIRS